MIDIHTHILPYVDDGSGDLDKSIAMLKEAESGGVTGVILTPHYRNKYLCEKDYLTAEFLSFKDKAKSAGVNLDLYLGQEIFVSRGVRDLVEKGKLCSLGDTKYLLLELNYNEKQDLTEIVYEYKLSGYTVIFAHVERYSYITIEDVVSVKQMGALIQVNAEGLVGLNGIKIKKRIKKLLKADLVDFVASDYHEDRNYVMKSAYEHVEKKYGKERAERIFKENQKKLLKGSD